MIVLLVVAAAALALLALIARPLFFATVDPDVARGPRSPGQDAWRRLSCPARLRRRRGQPDHGALLVFALLVFALLVMPAGTAQQLTARPMTSFWLTIVLGVLTAWLGLAAAYYSVYPVGFFITTFGFAGYVLAAAARFGLARAGRARVAVAPA